MTSDLDNNNPRDKSVLGRSGALRIALERARSIRFLCAENLYFVDKRAICHSTRTPQIDPERQGLISFLCYFSAVIQSLSTLGALLIAPDRSRGDID